MRTLPPAGAPLPLKSLVKAVNATRNPALVQKHLGWKLEEFFHAKHAVLTHSGRSGLALALRALHKSLPETQQNSRKEVLIPAFVSYSVPSAVVHAGFTPRLYDIDPTTLGPNLDSMRAGATEKTLAIVLCHQFGLSFDASPAMDVAQSVGAFLVDDAAQSMGGAVGTSPTGSMGHMGLFSLSRGKPLTAVEGGIVLTHDDALAEALQQCQEELYPAAHNQPKVGKDDILMGIKALALFMLRRPHMYTLPASLPWLNIGASIFEPDFPDGSMCPYAQGLTLASLPLLEQANAARRQWAERYARLLHSHEELRPILPEANTKPVYLRYPVMVEDTSRKCIQKILQHNAGRTARKLGISRAFPLPLHAVPNLKNHLAPHEGQVENDFSGARHAAEHLITLPTHDQVQGRDLDAMAHFFAQMCP